MNKLLKGTLNSAIAATFLMGALSSNAATTTENTDDGSALGTSSTPQIKQQDRRLDKKAPAKTMKKSTSHKSNNEMKMMDTDNNGIVSRDEYMKHYETTYNNMEQTDGGVSYKSSMNNKPIGTTTGISKNGSVDITKEGPIDGTTYGTN